MQKFLKILFLILVVPFMASVTISSASAAEKTVGKVIGGQQHRAPDWFKETFLDFKEDAAEAAAEGKHAMIFFDLAGCPYCARMMAESVEPQRALIEPYFNSIAIDIKGAREVSTDGENQMTEKQLATKMAIRFTPTIVFLDENAKPVFRINGFWNASQFRIALKFVRTKAYKKMKIGAFAKLQKSVPSYKMKDHTLLANVTDFSKIKTPLLVLFEDETCTACAELHESVLNRKAVTEELKKFTFVRLDARKDNPIIDTDGNKTTTAKWAEKLGVRISPTFISFDEGKERQRVDGTLYSHHFSAILAYVSGKHYKQHATWLSYLGVRSKKMLESGKNVDLSKDGMPLPQ